jgi:RNA 2',3'-cyclic 3'-phosphodiesterase
VRLFLAVELDEAVRRAAADTARTLAAALDRQGIRRGVSWVAPENLHFTLHFLGEVDEPTSRAVVDRVSPALSAAPFDLALAGLGTFPPSGPPRVIWLGVAEGARELAAVHAEIGRRLEGLGVPLERRPLSAHLTIGRVKSPLGPRLHDVLAGASLAREARCRVDHVTLFESRLSPRGATYSVIAAARLGYHHP